MNARQVIMSEHDWKVYKDKLNFVQGFSIPHVGQPEKYPCLAVTEFNDDLIQSPQWEHLYIYSNHIDDLKAIYDRLDDDGVKQIAKAQKMADRSPTVDWKKTIRDAHPAKVIGPDSSEWDKFWDDIGDVQQDPGVQGDINRSRNEWNEYESTRLGVIDISRTDFTAAIKLAKAFCDRWPNSTYRELLVYQLKTIQKQINHEETMVGAPTTDSTHDHYPDRAVHWSNVDSGSPEPRSRVSRKPTKEVNFVDEK